MFPGDADWAPSGQQQKVLWGRDGNAAPTTRTRRQNAKNVGKAILHLHLTRSRADNGEKLEFWRPTRGSAFSALPIDWAGSGGGVADVNNGKVGAATQWDGRVVAAETLEPVAKRLGVQERSAGFSFIMYIIASAPARALRGNSCLVHRALGQQAGKALFSFNMHLHCRAAVSWDESWDRQPVENVLFISQTSLNV